MNAARTEGDRDRVSFLALMQSTRCRDGEGKPKPIEYRRQTDTHTQPLSLTQKRHLLKEVVTKIIVSRDVFQRCSFDIIIMLTASVWMK